MNNIIYADTYKDYLRQKRKQVVVGIDLDDTTYPFVNRLLPKYNAKYNDNLTTSNITDWNIHSFLKPECENLFKEFADKDLFASITFDDNTMKTLTLLNEYYTLYFVTAGSPITIRYRDKMLSRIFDWYKSEQLIMLRNKHLFRCDYLIDDCLSNVIDDNYIGILVDQSWNRGKGYLTERTVYGLGSTVIDIIEREEKRKED